MFRSPGSDSAIIHPFAVACAHENLPEFGHTVLLWAHGTKALSGAAFSHICPPAVNFQNPYETNQAFFCTDSTMGTHDHGHTVFDLGHTYGHTFKRICAEHASPYRHKKPAFKRAINGLCGSVRNTQEVVLFADAKPSEDHA
jgi:hypothetical protein